MVKVMLVDDNPDIIFSLKKGLESLKEGYEITTANGGKEAVDIIRQNIPDIIVLDIMMPNMDGWDVVAKLRESTSTAKIKIIFLTAKDDQASKMLGALGVDDYIVKPVNIKDLNTRIKNVLAKKGG